MTALSEARAELAELEALYKSKTTGVEAQQAAIVPVAAKRDRLIAAARKVVTVSSAGGVKKVGTMADLHPEHYTAQNVASAIAAGTRKPKEVRDSISDGGFKLNWGGGYGVSLTARGLAQRVRYPHPEDVKAYQSMVRKRERAEAAATAARQAEAAALQLAFDNGTKITQDEMVELAFRRTLAELAVMAMPLDTKSKYEAERMVDERWGELTLSRAHVAHLAKKVDAPDCAVCKLQAEKRAEADKVAAYVAALPRKKFTCPDHGKKIGHFTRERARYLDAQHEALPVIYCPVDNRRFVDGPMFEADKVKAEKAAARATKAKPVVELHWTCPSCDEDVRDTPDDGYVVCPLCDASVTIETARKLAVKEVKAA